MSSNLSPSDYVSGFTDERLTIISKALLDQCFTTDEDLQSEHDSGYSIGCTRFDRQKNSLKKLPLKYSWLSITDGSNCLVLSIDGAPFRFTRDDYLNPKKTAAVSMSESESIQFRQYMLDFQVEDEQEDCEPVLWRFFVDVRENEDGDREYEIFFVGRNKLDEPVCVWQYSKDRVEISTPVITSTDNIMHESVKTQPAKTTLPNIEDEKLNREGNE